MIINRSNLIKIDELYLHDMEIFNIEVSYCDHKVVLILNNNLIKHKLIFHQVQYFSIDCFEPWGEGVYISEIKTIVNNIEKSIRKNEDCTVNEQAFIAEILLNSGDKIKVLSEHIEL